MRNGLIIHCDSKRGGKLNLKQTAPYPISSPGRLFISVARVVDWSADISLLPQSPTTASSAAPTSGRSLRFRFKPNLRNADAEPRGRPAGGALLTQRLLGTGVVTTVSWLVWTGDTAIFQIDTDISILWKILKYPNTDPWGVQAKENLY